MLYSSEFYVVGILSGEKACFGSIQSNSGLQVNKFSSFSVSKFGFMGVSSISEGALLMISSIAGSPSNNFCASSLNF